MHFEDDTERPVTVPQYMKEIVVEITRTAQQPGHQPAVRCFRARPLPTTRLCWPTPCAGRSASRRLRSRRASATCRTCCRALTGKIEFETVDDGREEQIVERLIQGAVGRLQPLLRR